MNKLEQGIQTAYSQARQRLADCRGDVQELQRREERARLASEQALAALEQALAAARAIGLTLADDDLAYTPEGDLSYQWRA